MPSFKSSRLDSPETQTAIIPLAKSWLDRFSIFLVSTMAIASSSCAPNFPTPNSETLQGQSAGTATPTAKAELRVVTTFLPMTQFTKAVVGSRAEVVQLLPTNVGPHDYQAKPGDAQIIAEADVLVKNGLDMEQFLENLIKNAENPHLKIIDTSQGIKLLSNDLGKEHNHDHGGDHHHDHGEYNPHIWLDPKRAIRQVENIRDGLIATDPSGKAIYTTNAAAYIQQLQKLDAETAQMLRPYSGQTFVAFHDFAPYFADSYNLKAEFLVDIPEEKPSPEDVKRVMDTVENTHLKTLLTEPQGRSVFNALAQDLNVGVSTFDPLETGGVEALQRDYYITTMRQNAKNLALAFTEKQNQSLLPLRIATPVGLRF